MAKGIGEDPRLSPGDLIARVEYPTTRADLVETAELSEAPPNVINFFKALPKERYSSPEEVMRDFAEAERRFVAPAEARERPSRENLGRVNPAGNKRR
jgi:hypothetical protein